MAMPAQVSFVHNGGQFKAELVAGIDSLCPERCWLCRSPLYGRAFYVTNPPLLHVHADCARECSFFENLPLARARSLVPAWYNGYRFSGYAAYCQHNYNPSYAYGQQQATASSQFGQQLGMTVIGAFLQALFSFMMGGFGLGAF